jgi:hypothetical protein
MRDRTPFCFVVLFEMLHEQLYDELGMSSIPIDMLGTGFFGTGFGGSRGFFPIEDVDFRSGLSGVCGSDLKSASAI